MAQRSADSGTDVHGLLRWVRRLSLLWWLVTLAGSLALVASPWLAWESNSDGGSTVNINGFNGLAADTLLGLQAGFGDSTQTDDGSVPPLPTLSSIPDTSGGSDAHAKQGIFVLVLGATTLFIALWTQWGEPARRKSMALTAVLLSALTLIPLLLELHSTLSGPSLFGTNSVGVGIIVGLCGASAVLLGMGLQYWSLSKTPEA